MVCSGTTNSVWKLDGITGQAYPAYAPDPTTTGVDCDTPTVHTDGTIFIYRAIGTTDTAIVGVDPTTGTGKFSVPIPEPNTTPAGYPAGDLEGSLIVAGDGYAYALYMSTNANGSIQSGYPAQLTAIRMSSTGEYQYIPIYETPGPTTDYLFGQMITNNDTGIVVSWGEAAYGANGQQFFKYGLAITNGTSVTSADGPVVPGQAYPVVPVLQAEDG